MSTVKRNLAIHYLRKGYSVDGMEIVNGSTPVMLITNRMKQWLEAKGLLHGRKSRIK